MPIGKLAGPLPDNMRHSPCVLIVEDEALIRFTTAELLRLEGFSVIEAATGDEALAILAAGKQVDVIFSDVNVPGNLNGLDLAGWVAKRVPGIPVILTSATGHATDLSIILKPYRDADVVAALRDVLHKGERPDESGGTGRRGHGGGRGSPDPQ